MDEPNVLPLELTAPTIQRLARKGVTEPLTDAECAQLCACVLFHVDSILRQRRVPKVGGAYGLERPPFPPAR